MADVEMSPSCSTLQGDRDSLGPIQPRDTSGCVPIRANYARVSGNLYRLRAVIEADSGDTDQKPCFDECLYLHKCFKCLLTRGLGIAVDPLAWHLHEM